MQLNKNARIYADKGYCSKENRSFLKRKSLKDGIMEKKVREKELTKRQKDKNRLISKKRYIVEQCNGTLKRILRFSRATYITTYKVEGQALLKAICFNLKKAVNSVQNVFNLPKRPKVLTLTG